MTLNSGPFGAHHLGGGSCGYDFFNKGPFGGRHSHGNSCPPITFEVVPY